MPLANYQTALVTGASSGMGAAIVRALAKEGLTVHALARRADRLQALADETGCRPLPLDLCDTGAIAAGLKDLAIDVVVNNAGLGVGGDPLQTVAMAEIDAMIDLNFRAVLHVLHHLLPGMVARDRGHVVTISSVGGHYPVPTGAGYGPTKAALHRMSQNLRFDLGGSRIRVTEIAPGRTETEFFDARYKGDREKIRQQFADAHATLQPEHVAETVLFALSMPWHVNVSLIELMPTQQVQGGVRFFKVR